MNRPIAMPAASARAASPEMASAEFESCVERFEAAWISGREPRIGDYLVSSDYRRRRELLCELICIDLEYRWKAGAADRSLHGPIPPTLANYAARFAELGDLAAPPIELISEEYRVRHRWGDRPAAGSFIARFPGRADELGRALADIDDDLRREAARPGPPATVSGEGRIAPLSDRDYVLVKHLGSGGMGKVYAARSKNPGRPVAIKMLRKQWLRYPAAVERFVSEAQTIERLRHPRIVPVHGLGRTRGGGYFIVMDLADGGDLASVLAAGPVPIADAAKWACQAAEALAYAHRSGVLHCDVKPSNLLLDQRRDVSLTDFGLARSIAVAARGRDEITGTLGYMAPEQFGLGSAGVGPATDVYGLGATLYTLLTGRTPVAGSSLIEVVKQHISPRLPAAPRAVRPEIPVELEAICLRCLAADPRERFAAMDDVASRIPFPLCSYS